MKKYILLSVLISNFTFAGQQQIDAVELAAMQHDTQKLEQLAVSNQGYDKALAHYRLAISHNLAAEQDKADDNLDAAMQLLEAKVDTNPNDDEAWALLANVYGLKVAYQPLTGAYYGPKSGKALSSAAKLNADNPRVYLVKGISDYTRPAMFGGSKKAAITALTKAISLYQFDQSSHYHWGQADAHIWRGLAYIDLGDNDKALADFQSALDIAPEYGWARFLQQANQ